MLRDELAIDARRCGLTVVHWPEGMSEAAWTILEPVVVMPCVRRVAEGCRNVKFCSTEGTYWISRMLGPQDDKFGALLHERHSCLRLQRALRSVPAADYIMRWQELVSSGSEDSDGAPASPPESDGHVAAYDPVFLLPFTLQVSIAVDTGY